MQIARRKIATILCLAFITAAVSGCSRPGVPTANAATVRVAEMATQAATGVGEVKQVHSLGPKGTIFVLEEFHTSRPGRVQSAVMLERLYIQGVKTIGLEGAYQSSKPLDGGWFHRAGSSSASRAREDVAVRLLGDGEINQAEFMMLVHPDVAVYGTELPEQHPKLDIKGNPEVVYLLGIAEKVLTPDARQKIGTLLQQKKRREAIELMLTADPWVKSQYDAARNVSSTSLKSVIERLKAIQAKANGLSVSIDPNTQGEMRNLLNFYELREHASVTMVQYVAELAGKTPGAAIAMIIGAAHTDLVAQLLKDRDFSFAVLSPRDLNPEEGSLSVEQFERKQHGRFAWISPGTLGRMLNTESNSPPVTQTATGRSFANMSLAGLLIAEAGRAGGPLPGPLWDELEKLEDIRIDKDSFSRDGHDVIFRASLKNVTGGDVQVWARVGTLPTSSATLDLEQKLLAEERRILASVDNAPKAKPALPKSAPGGGGRNGGSGTTRTATADEHPKRSRRGGREIVPLGPTQLAIFGNSKEDLGTARISG